MNIVEFEYINVSFLSYCSEVIVNCNIRDSKIN